MQPFHRTHALLGRIPGMFLSLRLHTHEPTETTKLHPATATAVQDGNYCNPSSTSPAATRSESSESTGATQILCIQEEGDSTPTHLDFVLKWGRFRVTGGCQLCASEEANPNLSILFFEIFFPLGLIQ
jgi:hypothetical protein